MGPTSARDKRPNGASIATWELCYIQGTTKWELYYTQHDTFGNYIKPNMTLQFNNLPL